MNCVHRVSVPVIAIAPLLFAPIARGDFINEDFTIVAPGATNFEILLSGNKVNQIGDNFISPFNNGAQVAFNAANNNTVITFNAVNGQNFGVGLKHFGFVLANAPFVEGGIGFGIPGVIAKLVSFPPGMAPEPLPALNPEIADVVNNGQVAVQLQNMSNDTISLFQVGYLVTATPFALQDLNRTTLPPSAFVSAGVADGTQLLSGESDFFNVPAVYGEYITIFADSQFSGSSSGNAYSGFVGDWVESQAIPEPRTSLLLLLAGCLLGIVATRRRFYR